jgi:hypothetical protein
MSVAYVTVVEMEWAPTPAPADPEGNPMTYAIQAEDLAKRLDLARAHLLVAEAAARRPRSRAN